jgi:hypothetical protein
MANETKVYVIKHNYAHGGDVYNTVRILHISSTEEKAHAKLKELWNAFMTSDVLIIEGYKESDIKHHPNMIEASNGWGFDEMFVNEIEVDAELVNNFY